MRRLFLSILAIMAAATIYADNISVEDIVLTDGGSETVDACLDNTTEYVALQMTLTLPEGVTLDKEGCSLSDRAGSGMTLSIGKKRDYYTIIVSSEGASSFTGTDGAVLHLTLKAEGTFEKGEATLSGIRVVDTDGNRVFLDDCTFLIGKKEPYVILSTNDDGTSTLTFVYDELRDQQSEATYSLQTLDELEPGWWLDGSCANVTQVVFDPSFTEVRPTTTHSWIRDMPVTEVEGIEYLNTSEVTDMGAMFYCSSSLTSLDLSHCDLSNVTDFTYTFYGCSSLRYLALPMEASAMDDTSCEGIGSWSEPCEIDVPVGFEFGVDTSGTFPWKGGWFKLNVLLGDANGDGRVNVADVMLTVNYSLGKNPNNFIFRNANVNGDEMVNVTDVMMILKLASQ